MVAFLKVVSASLLLVAGSAIATPQPAPSRFSLGDLNFHHLTTRQTTGFNPANIPDQCTSQCEGLTQLRGCSDVQCICNNAVADTLKACSRCALSLENTDEARDQLQAQLDRYHDGCEQAGVNVKSEKLNGALGMSSEFLGVSSLLVLVAIAAIGV
ncbi:hypothetical protein ONZ45_g17592 [Pleurotus djamor]|nr:hypothetical protein ONZ45_g17592 [Pleurotus djamor]